MNVTMWHGWMNRARSDTDSHEYIIKRREKKVGCPRVSKSVGEILREWLGCTPSSKKTKQEGRFIPEVVIQEGDGSWY